MKKICPIVAKKANTILGVTKKGVGNKKENIRMPVYKAIVCPLSEFSRQHWPPWSQKCYSIKDTETGDKDD